MKNIICAMDDVREDFLRPPRGTTPAAVIANKPTTFGARMIKLNIKDRLKVVKTFKRQRVPYCTISGNESSVTLKTCLARDSSIVKESQIVFASGRHKLKRKQWSEWNRCYRHYTVLSRRSIRNVTSCFKHTQMTKAQISCVSAMADQRNRFSIIRKMNNSTF